MPLKHKSAIFLILIVALLFFAPPVFADEKTELERQLQEIENEISIFEQELSTIKGEKNTLQNKIKQLKAEQSSINLQIKSTNLRISDLDNRIADTKLAIDGNIVRIEELRQDMADYIRIIKKYDDFPLLYVILTQDNWSRVFDEIERFFQISARLNTLFEETGRLKSILNQRAEILAETQNEANNLLSMKVLQQQQLAGSVSEQNMILAKTKGRESEYQSVLKDTQKRAVEIKSRLYQLIDVSAQITFGEAVIIAKWASEQTGVRTVFLLAILTQESNLGKNVGTCNRANDPPEKSWRVVMKPERDQEPFRQITAELGMNTDTTPVSCPMRDKKGNRIGWGGAMGPAQFIPSTWMGYKNKVAAITGKTANPWDIRDAFIAAAIKLKAGGAGTKAGEWAAAMRYFSGSTNIKYRFYGDNVVKMADQYQDDINEL